MAKDWLKMENQKKAFEWLAIVCSVILIGYNVAAIMFASFYTTLQADDFSHACGVGVFHTGIAEYFISSVQYAKTKYMDWQGTYFSMFLQAFLSPLNNYGLPQLRVVMMLNAALFFGSLFLLVWSVLNLFVKNAWHVKLLICLCIIIPVLNFRSYTEIFFWFSGAVSYSMPLTCLFFSITLLLKWKEDQKRSWLVALSSFLGICVGGGTLMVAGTGCYFMLLWILARYMRTRKLSKSDTGCFLVFLTAALLNAMAPGNFVRHKYIDDGLHFGKALWYSCRIYYSEIEWLLKDTGMVVFMLMVIICGIVLYKENIIDLNIYFFVSILGILAPVVAIFPMSLGYSGISYYPNRCVFVVELIMEIAMVNLSFLVGCIIRRYVGTAYVTAVIFSGLLIFVSVCTGKYRFSDMVMWRLSVKMADGTIPRYYEECKAILDYLDTCEEKDVVISDSPESVELFGSFAISEDPDNWINCSIADYYEKNSVRRMIN